MVVLVWKVLELSLAVFVHMAILETSVKLILVMVIKLMLAFLKPKSCKTAAGLCELNLIFFSLAEPSSADSMLVNQSTLCSDSLTMRQYTQV